jgi:hypothetical protein
MHDLVDGRSWSITEISALDVCTSAPICPTASQTFAMRDDDPRFLADDSWSITQVRASEVYEDQSIARLDARAKPSVEKAASPKPQRLAYLTTNEVRKIYNAMSYAMWKDGIVMNSHVIIMWSMMGLSEAEGDEILGDYLHKAQKWCQVGTKPRQRRVANARMGGQLRYVWVHENDLRRGFHSHLLLYLPDGALQCFKAWSRKALVDMTGKPLPERAFYLAPNRGKTEQDRVWLAWKWFRYLSKQLRPDAKIFWRDGDMGIHEAWVREVIKPCRIRESPPLPLKTLVNVSQNIGAGAQRNDRYVSRWDACVFDEFYSGNEMFEWRRRVEYERSEKNQQELIATLQI